MRKRSCYVDYIIDFIYRCREELNDISTVFICRLTLRWRQSTRNRYKSELFCKPDYIDIGIRRKDKFRTCVICRHKVFFTDDRACTYRHFISELVFYLFYKCRRQCGPMGTSAPTMDVLLG